MSGLQGYVIHSFIIHADGIAWVDPPLNVSVILSVCLSVCVYVFLSVCPHDKTKTAEIKIAKLGIEIVHHDTSPTN